MARSAQRRSTKVTLHAAYKIKTKVALRKSGLAVHSTPIQKLDPPGRSQGLPCRDMLPLRENVVQIIAKWDIRKIKSTKIWKLQMRSAKNEGASAVSYTLWCHLKERRGAETIYEKMHENFYENFDRFMKIMLKRRKLKFWWSRDFQLLVHTREGIKKSSFGPFDWKLVLFSQLSTLLSPLLSLISVGSTTEALEANSSTAKIIKKIVTKTFKRKANIASKHVSNGVLEVRIR